jgi:NAD-specific glutamate dehydrogenase
LWEDLHDEQRALAADVLRESGNGPVPERVSGWIAHNAEPVERCLQVLADVKAGTAYDLAMLSVAVREIRNLIEATSAPAPEASELIEPPVAPLSGF